MKKNSQPHPFMFSLRNLFNGGYTNKFFNKAQELIVEQKITSNNYSSQSVSLLKQDILLLEDMIESPEYINGYNYSQNIEDLTLRIAARAHVINDDYNN